jgi:hypothetical protein
MYYEQRDTSILALFFTGDMSIENLTRKFDQFISLAPLLYIIDFEGYFEITI